MNRELWIELVNGEMIYSSITCQQEEKCEVICVSAPQFAFYWLSLRFTVFFTFHRSEILFHTWRFTDPPHDSQFTVYFLVLNSRLAVWFTDHSVIYGSRFIIHSSPFASWLAVRIVRFAVYSLQYPSRFMIHSFLDSWHKRFKQTMDREANCKPWNKL